MIAGKTLVDHTKLFTPNNHEMNRKIKCKYFTGKYDKGKHKPWLWMKKIDETRNFSLEKIKQ